MKIQKKIVLIEDNEALAHIIAKPLIKNGFEVDFFISPETFLNQYKFEHPALYIVGTDDSLLIKEIRQHSLLHPVIRISACEDSEVVIQALKEGADHYLIKPFDTDELVMRSLIAWDKYLILSRYSQSLNAKTL